MINIFFTSLFTVGAREGLPDYIKTSIVLTNKLLFIAVFIAAVPFTIFTKLYFEAILFVPIAGVLFNLLVYFLNYTGFYNIGRFLFSIIPVSLISTYNASLTATGEEPIAAATMLCLSFSFIPFVIFGLKENLFLIISVLYGFLLIILFNFHNNLFNFSVDATQLRVGYLRYFMITMACGIGFFIMYGLILSNKKSEEKTNSLLENINNSNNLLTQSQDDLKHKLEELEIARKEEEKRNWASEGLTKFGEILRSNRDITGLSDDVLSTLVKYIGANQGGLYLVIEETAETYIELLSGYAYEQKKYNERRIEVGQGLLGQTYKEKSYKYLTELPDGYIEITSGLGESTPAYLLIVPMIINNKVEGLIEISSFLEIEQYKIDFIERLGEQIASALKSKKVDERTKILLEETQQQAEEMRTQEEEVRQNMEELVATQEELFRKNQETELKTNELQQQKDNLEKWQFNVAAILDGVPGAIIIIDKNLIIEDTNMAGEELTGYRIEEMEGVSFQDFLTDVKIADIPLKERIETTFLGKGKRPRKIAIISRDILKKDGKKRLFLLQDLTA